MLIEGLSKLLTGNVCHITANLLCRDCGASRTNTSHFWTFDSCDSCTDLVVFNVVTLAF